MFTTGVLQSFLERLQQQTKMLEESVKLVQTEVVILKRFLYKLTSIFCHDKGYKMMKQVQKSINKFLAVDISKALVNLHEQHSLIYSTERFVYVPPKPKFQFALVRLQGTARLLAQILCYCQRFGSFVIQKIHFGHFVNINVISMSFAARIWYAIFIFLFGFASLNFLYHSVYKNRSLSLHIMHILANTFSDVNHIYNSKGFPECSVQFLPDGQALPESLLDWLKRDPSLQDIQSLQVLSL